MHLARLNLVNFRSFRRLEVDVPEGPSLIVGANAQGKTTILEAIYLLAIAKSFRAENEREVVNWDAASTLEQAAVDGTVQLDGSRTRIIVGYQTHFRARSAASQGAPIHSVRKEVRVDGVRRTAAELVGLLNVVLFSAEDIRLVQGSPSVRRRYLDILISQSSPAYLRTLQRYQKVLHQRNQLLKLIRDGRARESEMAFWDEQLVQAGSLIVQQRTDTMTELAQTARATQRELTGDAEDLRLEYLPNVTQADDAGDCAAELLKGLEALRDREIRLGSTALGPHRDDFQLLVGDVDMGVYSSRGQARTLALTLRLSEAQYLSAYKGEPLVLLDDILSELDEERREQVLERVLAYGQSVITATDLDPFSNAYLSRASILRLCEGELRRAND